MAIGNNNVNLWPNRVKRRIADNQLHFSCKLQAAATGAGAGDGSARVLASAANRLIGEVVQSRRRPLLGPSPGWKRPLALSHLRHY